MSKFAVNEREFLPAAVEILETPASPLKHVLTVGICLLFVLFLLWAWIGQLDIVVEAQGRVIPSGQVKTISALQVARVRTIFVQEGSRVEQGEVLVELDPNPSDLEALVEQPAQDWMSAKLALIRLEYLLELAEAVNPADHIQPDNLEKRAESVVFPVSPSPQRWLAENHALNSELNSFLTADVAFTRKSEEIQAMLAADDQELQRLNLLKPIHDKQEVATRGLLKKNMLSEVEWLARREKQIDTESQIGMIRQRSNEHQARLKSTLSEQQQKRQEFYARIHRERLQASQQLEQAATVLKKASQREQNQSITSPVAGIVQQLQIRSEGDVVQPAQPIMVVVPEAATLEVEAMIQNKDIGWITEGQPVKIKVESFPYTRYGYLEGIIHSMAADAVADEQKNWTYPVRINIARPWFEVKRQRFRVQPGMTLTADVIVGQRRLLEFFLSPLLRYQKETFRETM